MKANQSFRAVVGSLKAIKFSYIFFTFVPITLNTSYIRVPIRPRTLVFFQFSNGGQGLHFCAQMYFFLFKGSMLASNITIYVGLGIDNRNQAMFSTIIFTVYRLLINKDYSFCLVFCLFLLSPLLLTSHPLNSRLLRTPNLKKIANVIRYSAHLHISLRHLK